MGWILYFCEEKSVRRHRLARVRTAPSREQGCDIFRFPDSSSNVHHSSHDSSDHISEKAVCLDGEMQLASAGGTSDFVPAGVFDVTDGSCVVRALFLEATAIVHSGKKLAGALHTFKVQAVSAMPAEFVYEGVFL